MKRRSKEYSCPVCAYGLRHPPSDFNICPCCGTEFGYSDSGITYENLRKRWIARGLSWHSKVEKPPKNWNPWLQVSRFHPVPLTLAALGETEPARLEVVLVQQPFAPVQAFTTAVRGF